MMKKRTSVFDKDIEDKAKDAENREALSKIDEDIQKGQEQVIIQVAQAGTLEEQRNDIEEYPIENTSTQTEEDRVIVTEDKTSDDSFKNAASALEERSVYASSESRHGKTKVGKTLTTMSIDEDAYDALYEMERITKKRTGNKKYGRGDAASEAILYYYNHVFQK